MSRVFPRCVRGVAFRYLRCVSDSSGAADRVLEMREMPRQRFALGKFARPARKLSIRPSRAGLLSITVEQMRLQELRKQRKQHENGLWRLCRRMRCCGCR